MKIYLAALVLTLSACSQQHEQAVPSVVISPIARQLASCAIAANVSSAWKPEERIGRYQVNRGAAETRVERDNPQLDRQSAAAIVGVLVEDRTMVFSSNFYEANCV